MGTFSNGLPRIILETKSFSCFAGFVSGTLSVSVYDAGTEKFPVIVTAETNLGSGSFTLEISGNQKFKEEFSGIDVEVEISQWSCTDEKLSFNVNAVAKKLFFKCTVFDGSLSGDRYNEDLHKRIVNEAVAKIEEMS